jgi:hypothetical protein
MSNLPAGQQTQFTGSSVATHVSSLGQQFPEKQYVFPAFAGHPPAELIDRLSKAGDVHSAKSNAVIPVTATRNRKRRDV